MVAPLDLGTLVGVRVTDVGRDSLARILGRLAERGATGGGATPLCEVAADVTGASGAGIMLLFGNQPTGSLCTTNAVSSLIEELQYTLGEGPCVDAHTYGAAVSEPDLASPVLPRWPGFAPPAVAAGARAVFGFPVRVGAARLGALNLYRDRPGLLAEDELADALVMADVAARAILAMQADAPAGMLAVELEAGANFQFVVHQAAGMVSVQLGVNMVDAMVRLRAYAFRTGRLIGEVAQDVVSRRLRFEPEADI